MSGIFHHLMAFVTSAVTDPFWKYVTLLLHGNGTNGAQNNTFIDSSSNAFTVTRNGSTTQGSFSPFGPDWSNYFNGSSYLLTTATQVIPSGSFTVQTWVFPTSSADSYAVAQGTTGNAGRFSLGITSTLWFVQIGSANVNAGSVTLNQWTHIAATFNGTTLTLYVNGVSVGTAATTTNAQNTTLRIATLGPADWGTYYWTGYISNVRATNTVEFTSTFTPSTTPLTAITGTSVLTCQASRFVDSSSNAYTLTITGNAYIQRFSPFSMGSAYSTSVIGGAGYFNGTTDYLTIPYNISTVQWWDTDYTIEMWINSPTHSQAATNGNPLQVNYGDPATSSTYWAFGTNTAGKLYFYYYNGSIITTAISTALVPLNSWNHLAMVYTNSTSTLKGYINGAQVFSVAKSGTPQGASGFTLNIGSSDAVRYSGYISNVRIVRGTAVYTAAFTPPTAPLTAITNTSLLLSAINGGVYDNAMISNLVTAGSAQISTAQSKFGGSSILFNGTTSYLTAPTNNIYNIYSGAFTIEMWVYRLGNGSGGASSLDAVLGTNNAANSVYGIYINRTTGVISFYTASGGLVSSSNTLSNSTWTHIAICRTSSNNLQIFINGTSGYSASYTGTATLINPLYIGNDGTGATGNNLFYGYIDDFRFTAGYARYTANFTPPTAAFPNY